MRTPDFIHANGLSIPKAPATRRPSDTAAEAGIAHILDVQRNAAPGPTDLSWIPEGDSRLLEG
ncbi:hypothetical protein ACIQXM_18020 [Arthrobacter sp. NPDC097144]|uniref:hypothetical protein n=1 Tax=Arthrobacter sp. NPDC097144 TaxID=3363946 RepID=UPI0037F912AA